MTITSCNEYYLAFLIGTTDFENILPIKLDDEDVNSTDVRLFTTNDELTLEYDETVILKFTPDRASLIPGVERAGELHCNCVYH